MCLIDYFAIYIDYFSIPTESYFINLQSEQVTKK